MFYYSLVQSSRSFICTVQIFTPSLVWPVAPLTRAVAVKLFACHVWCCDKHRCADSPLCGILNVQHCLKIHERHLLWQCIELISLDRVYVRGKRRLACFKLLLSRLWWLKCSLFSFKFCQTLDSREILRHNFTEDQSGTFIILSAHKSRAGHVIIDTKVTWQ